jgi:hypothetical protein
MLAFAAIILVGGGAAAGIAQAVASLVWVLLIAATAVAVLAAAGMTVLVVYRLRHAGGALRTIPQPQFHQLGATVKPQVTAPQLPQINHFYGGTHMHVAAGTSPAPVVPVLPLRDAIIAEED